MLALALLIAAQLAQHSTGLILPSAEERARIAREQRERQCKSWFSVTRDTPHEGRVYVVKYTYCLENNEPVPPNSWAKVEVSLKVPMPNGRTLDKPIGEFLVQEAHPGDEEDEITLIKWATTTYIQDHGELPTGGRPKG